jgi:hypothetical protein
MSARSALLELAANGVDVDSGDASRLDPRLGGDEVERLMQLLSRHRLELRQILLEQTDRDIKAVRAEASLPANRLTDFTGRDEGKGT